MYTYDLVISKLVDKEDAVLIASDQATCVYLEISYVTHYVRIINLNSRLRFSYI
jgi:hypothetical protein